MSTEPHCFTCGTEIPLVKAVVGDDLPNEGDVSMCFYCGAIAICTGKGNEIREVTDDELMKIVKDPEVRRARAMRAQAWQEWKSLG